MFLSTKTGTMIEYSLGSCRGRKKVAQVGYLGSGARPRAPDMLNRDPDTIGGPLSARAGYRRGILSVPNCAVQGACIGYMHLASADTDMVGHHVS